MKNHYLPQFLLRGFGDAGGLTEFNIITGKYERRSVGNAGQKRHFYSVELETGLLQTVDGRASEVFHRHFRGSGERKIVLTDGDRKHLSEWLALFFFRTPRSYAETDRVTTEIKNDRAFTVECVTGYMDQFQAKLRLQTDAKSVKSAAELDDPQIRQAMIDLLVDRYVKNPTLRTKPRDAFLNHMKGSSLEHFGGRLLQLRWRWLISDGAFIIGDNPLCRCSRNTGVWDYGIGHRDIDVFIPLTSSLCLAMRRGDQERDTVRRCQRDLRREINRLQLFSALEKVYGPSGIINAMAEGLVRRHNQRVRDG